MSATRVSERSIFAPPVPTDLSEPGLLHEPWSLAKRLRFRFIACYFLLYGFASYVGSIPFLGVFAVMYWLYRNRQRFGATDRFATDPMCGMQVEIANAPARLDGRFFCSDHCKHKFQQQISA